MYKSTEILSTDDA